MDVIKKNQGVGVSTENPLKTFLKKTHPFLSLDLCWLLRKWKCLPSLCWLLSKWRHFPSNASVLVPANFGFACPASRVVLDSRYRPKGVLPPKVFRAFLTHF